MRTRLAILAIGSALLGGCVEFNAECSPPVDGPDEVLTYLAKPLPVERAVVRTRESGLGNVMADAYLAALRDGTGPRPTIAIENAGAIREQGLCLTRTALGTGPLTRKVLKDTVPFSNRLVMVTVSELELFDVLEHAVATVGLPGVSPAGQFLQVSGLSFEVDCSKAPEKLVNGPNGMQREAKGQRVTSLTIAGRTITRDKADPGLQLIVALNDYLAGGGDYFIDLGRKEVTPSNPERYTYLVLEEYLRGLGATAQQPVDLSVNAAQPRLVMKNCN